MWDLVSRGLVLPDLALWGAFLQEMAWQDRALERSVPQGIVHLEFAIRDLVPPSRLLPLVV